MGTIEERKANDVSMNEMAKICAKGNKDAESYLLSLSYAMRIFDDLIDKDYPVSDKQICRAFFILMAELWLNPFFRRHAYLLIPLHIASYNAFMESNLWAKSEDKLKKIYAHVMKDFVDEIFGMVAFLAGGYNHMREMSLKTKEIFLEEI